MSLTVFDSRTGKSKKIDIETVWRVTEIVRAGGSVYVNVVQRKYKRTAKVRTFKLVTK